jgi:hypothetical protein
VGRIDSRKKSMWEALLNAIIGFLLGILLNVVILAPMMGISYNMSLEVAAIISIVYGGISMLRSYIIRRVFLRIKNGWRLF